MKKKVILAYSGGLDTSCLVKWYELRGFDVIAYMGDVGQEKSYKKYHKRALGTGAKKLIVDDLKKSFVKNYITPTIKAGAVYENDYYLATALSRPLIAEGMVRQAKKEKAQYLAHGCTGKGNDQVRFEVSIAALDSKLKVLAPVREWELTTRESEIEYAKKHKIPIDVTKKKPYSIDINLWGISIEGGVLEDPYTEPKEDIYLWSRSVSKAPANPEYVTLDFTKGVPSKINGKAQDLTTIINELNQKAGKHGVGRSDMIENRLVGIKSREVYEAPAAMVIHQAHKALEALILDREQLHYKAHLALKYAELVYYGLWFTPLRNSLDAFMDATQKKVSGRVRIKLHKGHCTVVGRKSPHSIYKKELATYSEGDLFDQSLAKGFIDLWGLPYKGSCKLKK